VKYLKADEMAFECRQLLYIAHVNDVPSTLTEGILSRSVIEEREIPHTAIADLHQWTQSEMVSITVFNMAGNAGIQRG
jgi:hypothetical protein